jgi:uncharacterized membrane protein YkgB
VSKKPLSAEEQMTAVAGIVGIAAIVILCIVLAGIVLGVMALAKHGLLIPVGIVLLILLLVVGVVKLVRRGA